MLTILYEHRLLTFLSLFFLLLSMICQIISGVIYQGMIKQSDNMSAVENKLLKECTQKYADYFKLNGRIVNTAVFVDRFLQKISFCKIHLSRLTHIGGQLMMLSVLMAGITVCLILAAGGTLFQIIPYYLISILGLYLYFSIAGIMDVQERKQILRTNLTDYLENYLAPLLEIERENAMEEGVRKREVYVQEFPEEFVKAVRKEASQKEENKEAHSQNKEQELENLLEEIFPVF